MASTGVSPRRRASESREGRAAKVGLRVLPPDLPDLAPVPLRTSPLRRTRPASRPPQPPPVLKEPPTEAAQPAEKHQPPQAPLPPVPMLAVLDSAAASLMVPPPKPLPQQPQLQPQPEAQSLPRPEPQLQPAPQTQPETPTAPQPLPTSQAQTQLQTLASPVAEKQRQVSCVPVRGGKASEASVTIVVKSVVPVRTVDGDLLLLCPVRMSLRKYTFTVVHTETQIGVPEGWRGFLTAPFQLAANGLSFGLLVLAPSNRDTISLSIFNANSTDVHLEAGAPLALLSLVPFERIPADVMKALAL